MSCNNQHPLYSGRVRAVLCPSVDSPDLASGTAQLYPAFWICRSTCDSSQSQYQFVCLLTEKVVPEQLASGRYTESVKQV